MVLALEGEKTPYGTLLVTSLGKCYYSHSS